MIYLTTAFFIYYSAACLPSLLCRESNDKKATLISVRARSVIFRFIFNQKYQV